MDAPDADPRLLTQSLGFIRRINRFCRYNAATIWHLARFSRRWAPSERIDIIDFATGSADVPLAILRWADRRRLNVRIVGVDLHAATARVARQASGDPRLSIVRADLLKPPFGARSFDYAICSMALHHLSDEQALAALVAMDRISRRGVLVADIQRSRRAYLWIRSFTLLSNPMVRHDAAVSVLQAFNRAEILRLRDRADLDYLRYHRHFGHRFVLAGEKRELQTRRLDAT